MGDFDRCPNYSFLSIFDMCVCGFGGRGWEVGDGGLVDKVSICYRVQTLNCHFWCCNGFEITSASEKHMVEDDILFTNHLAVIMGISSTRA